MTPRPPPSIPITVLCGFLGAGKTTLLNALLRQSGARRIAVIVNEFGAANIDASLVVHAQEEVTELSDGCICCTLRGDLLLAVDGLLRTRELDAIVVESTGIGEPLPIAQSFCLTPEELDLDPTLPDLRGRVHVDAMVTVVDAAQFFDLWNREGALPDDGQERGYGELLAEQLEFADIVVLNKTDLAAGEDLARLRGLLGVTNPRARVLEAVRGELPVGELLDTGLFDPQAAMQLDAWMAELSREHTPESETYGLGTHIYRAARPLDPEKLRAALTGGLPDGVIRSKGWLDLGDGLATLWNHTGRQLALEGVGTWHDPAEAHTEIVFIGRGLDGGALNALLDGAARR